MALGEEGGSSGIPATMLVSPTGVGNSAMPYPYPVFGGMGGGSGMSNGWGDGAWIILLIIVLLAAGGGWGNNSGNGFGQPIVVNDGGGYGSVQRGFDQAAIMAGINALTSSVCNGFGDIQYAICNSFGQAEIADNARQMANMQQMYNLSTQFSDCCCENRIATIQTQNVVATEGAATRLAIQNQTQSILDKLCALELDNYKRENDNLRTQLNMATLAASQTAQTAQITNNIYNRLSTCPVGTVPVYGETPIFRCNNNGCGCGGNNF